ncbi:MAG: DUF736 domain-containing protein [Alphaproteobacteria bacterium]|nr:DUF736 domain-containing protein [Alphaproteobacteria bacterium]MBU0859074.1 DUF736 domain-containing protein [Alphaproteobacteria bacterium]
MAKGRLIVSEKDNGLVGQIRTRRLNETFQLMINTHPVGQKPASHIIIARAPAGHDFEAGLAWKYKIERGQMAGQHGFNLLFNDPDYGKPFWVSAFPVAANQWDLSVKSDEEMTDTKDQAAA